MNKKQIAVFLSFFPIFLGLVDVLLRGYYLKNFTEAIYFSLHDPGRMVHSFILFPISIYVLVINLLVTNIKVHFAKVKGIITIIFLFLEILAVFQAYNDAKDGYNNRLPMPYNLRLGTQELIEMHHSISSEIGKYGKTSLSREEYRNKIAELRKPYMELSSSLKGEPNDFWSNSTFYTKYSIFVSFIGISYVILLFLIIALYAIQRQRIDEPLLKAFIINTAILSTWFIFRSYSEWYLNLGDFDVQKDAKFIVLPFDTIILLITVFFLYQRKRFLSYLASCTAIAVSIIIIGLRLKPELFLSEITFPSDLSIENIISMLFTGCFGIGTIIWNFRNNNLQQESEFREPQKEMNQADIEFREERAYSAIRPIVHEELVNKYIKEIEDKLDNQKVHLDAELTLSKLSTTLGIPLHHLSYVLNDKMRCRFSDLINKYRIQEAKQKLQDPAFKYYKMETIGYECGFNSKATFYRVFKKECNQSPSEFQKRLIQEQEFK